MTDKQFEHLIELIDGKTSVRLPSFIIDSPWLPNWAGVKILDYFTSEELWFDCHLKASKSFSEVLFLPGFWSEFGMCTEPSAFGARCTFPENEFPHAHRVIHDSREIESLVVPNPATDGLLPFMLKRLDRYRKRIEKEGHSIRFSVSRGPLNIASYLMGTTEFLMLMMMEPEIAHQLISKITLFLKEWHLLQRSRIDSIDGIFMLDDIIGFMSREQFEEFGLPYFKTLYHDAGKLRFLHNDAPSRESAPLLETMGVNIFNMGIDVSLPELRALCGPDVVLMGNLPPRDVLATASGEEIKVATAAMMAPMEGDPRILPSCGGGMPPGVSSEQIRAFVERVRGGERG